VKTKTFIAFSFLFLLSSFIQAKNGFVFLGPTGGTAWTYFSYFPPPLELADTNKQEVYFDRVYKLTSLSDSLKKMTLIPSVAEAKIFPIDSAWMEFRLCEEKEVYLGFFVPESLIIKQNIISWLNREGWEKVTGF